MMWTKSASIQNKWTKRHGKRKRQFKSFVNLMQEMKEKKRENGDNLEGTRGWPVKCGQSVPHKTHVRGKETGENLNIIVTIIFIRSRMVQGSLLNQHRTHLPLLRRIIKS